MLERGITMKVVDFLKYLNDIGYDANTELDFEVFNHKYGKGLIFHVETIIDEREYSDQNTISVEFEDGLIKDIKEYFS